MENPCYKYDSIKTHYIHSILVDHLLFYKLDIYIQVTGKIKYYSINITLFPS